MSVKKRYWSHKRKRNWNLENVKL